MVRGGMGIFVRMWAQGTGKSRQEVLELTAGFGSEIAAFDSANFEEIGAWQLARVDQQHRPQTFRPKQRG